MSESAALRRKKSRDTAPATGGLLSDEDLYLFNEGSHLRLYEKLGCHLGSHEGREGAWFAVWAPDAAHVSVIGDFNGWNREANGIHAVQSSGIWEGFIPGISAGDVYKFHIASRYNGYGVDKADPFAFRAEMPPKTASVAWRSEYTWGDGAWMADRGSRNSLGEAISVYEVHAGSWRRIPEEGDRPLTYRELAPALAAYVETLGFTHVEFLPLMEHPFYGSWGYQTTGYFAPTSRYGTPDDFKYLVDYLHRRGIGVILDWVPSHFPTDEHGLGYFDGTHLYEHASPAQGFHPDWGSLIFNYGRPEVRSFLFSSAMYWLDEFHADGLRVDAVASMLYLDYSRKAGEWVPNRYGGRENIEAIDFLRRLNQEVYGHYPDVQMMAEESTAWPMVSRPTYVGGLGFGLKWDMGWMHDTLQYIHLDPVHRKYHHGELTFRALYAFTENFLLPLSHDEVVHGKGSLLGSMPGDDWQKFANLRLLFSLMYAEAGKKLLFMGGEFGQWSEWHHDSSLDWHLTNYDNHAGLQRLVTDLNRLYRAEPALHRYDFDPAGFRWLDANDWEQSVLAFLRLGQEGERPVIAAFNFTPVARENYRVGVPGAGRWREVLNSDATDYGGSGMGNPHGAEATPIPWQDHDWSIVLALPPLAGLYLCRDA